MFSPDPTSLLINPAVAAVFAALPAVVGVIALVLGGRAPSGSTRWMTRIAGAVLILDGIVNGGLMLLMYSGAVDGEALEALNVVWSVLDAVLMIAGLGLLLVALGLTGRAAAGTGANASAPPPGRPGAPAAPGPGGPGWGGPARPGGYGEPGAPGAPSGPGGPGGTPPPDGSAGGPPQPPAGPPRS
ncbi:hypothetical protein [Streptomonospora sp. PA3]|uniref:hypothetical protein n=1 Tax=Streptomonospora sp. PA3 TaxID=2607326 RepID=UPI001642E951|nr:hypothetical protein [Streptomonospora sp. PA3]